MITSVVWGQGELVPGELRINEISFVPAQDDNQWVEIYNAHTEELDLTGYVLLDQDGNTLELPPGLNTVPAGAFVVVHFDGTGSLNDDYNFEDNAAFVHSDANVINPLGSQSGQVALYNNSVFNQDSIVSYVAWGEVDDANGIALDAVQAGLWVSSDYAIPLAGSEFSPKGPIFDIPEGGSLGITGVVAPADHTARSPYQADEVTPGAINPLPAPTLYLPGDGDEYNQGVFSFSWIDHPHAAHYHIQIDTTPDFLSLIVDEVELTDNHYLPDTGLPLDAVYYWRVRMIDANEIPGPWSLTYEVTVGFPSPPIVNFVAQQVFVPNNGDVSLSGRVTDGVSGRPLSGVTIKVGDAASTVTAADGSWSVTGLTDNQTYSVQAELANYDPKTIEVAVSGHTTGANVALAGKMKVLNVTALAARKDTALLCIDGCQETNANNKHWDGSHEALAHWWDHESMYCPYTAIRMVNNFYGGTITRDEVAWRIKGQDNRPEGDIAHGQGTSDAETTTGLTWALKTNNASVNYSRVRPTDAELKTWIDGGRPLMYSTPRHWMVVDGYRYVNKQVQARFLNTDNDGSVAWRRFSTHSFDSYFVPIKGLNARKTDPDVTMDGDGDGVKDFDEDKRFQSVKDHPDTDLDEVGDKDDIRNYTFHRFYHNAHRRNLPPSLYDIDGDGQRAENDCDSDNDADFDGGEDINGNGHCPEDGETCLYDATSGIISVETDKSVYGPGENVFLFGETLHRESTYPYEIIPDCPDLVDGDALGQSGTVMTDANGVIPLTNIFVCDTPGEYLVVVDVLRDHLYSEPDNWDPWVCFVCEGPAIDISSFTDASDDVMDLFTLNPLNDPTADIIRGSIDPSNGGIIMVNLAAPFGQNDFSFAVILDVFFANNNGRTFIYQMHDGVPTIGELDPLTFTPIPNSPAVVTYSYEDGIFSAALNGGNGSDLLDPLPLAVRVESFHKANINSPTSNDVAEVLFGQPDQIPSL